MHPQALALYREFEAMLGGRPAARSGCGDRRSCAAAESRRRLWRVATMTKPSHRNTTFDELAVGQTARIERTVTASDLYVFAHASGNTNPIHMPGMDVDKDGTVDTVAPSLWIGSLVSSVLGTHPAWCRHALPRPDLSVPRPRSPRRQARRFRALHREARETGRSCSRPGSRRPTVRRCSKASPRSRRPTATIILKDQQLPMLLRR